MGFLAPIIGLVSLVCFILVLIKQFQIGGAVHGIIGIITCGLWTLIWGWMNVDKTGQKTIMLIWTGLVILNLLLGVFGGFSYGFSYGNAN